MEITIQNLKKTKNNFQNVEKEFQKTSNFNPSKNSYRHTLLIKKSCHHRLLSMKASPSPSKKFKNYMSHLPVPLAKQLDRMKKMRSKNSNNECEDEFEYSFEFNDE